MELHCTLVRSPGSGRQQLPLELTINAPEGTTGKDIHAQLIQKFGTGSISIRGRDIGSMSMGTPPLVNGAILVDGPSRQNAPAARHRLTGEDARLALAVHTGVGAGTLVPLRRGSYTIGRSGTRIIIRDPELSRTHARLDVTGTDIVITDLDSANGIHINGERVRNAAVSTASEIRCGNTTMSLAFMDPSDEVHADAGASTQQTLIVQNRTDTGNRALLLLAAVTPLLIGAGVAVLTGMWMLLAFAAASAMSLLVPLALGRRQRHDLLKAVASAVTADHDRRRRSGPSLALLALAAGQAQSTTASCCEADRAWLRLGQGTRPANVKVEPAASFVRIPCLDAVPIFLDPALPATFGGPPTVIDGMVRSLLMQLAGYPRCRRTRVVVQGQPHRLPVAARYLPRVTLIASTADIPAIIQAGFGRAYQHGVLLLLSTSVAEDDTGIVAESAAALGWQVLKFSTAESGDTCDVLLTERSSLMRLRAGDVTFVPDLAPEDVFVSFCRKLAVQQEELNNEEPSVPSVCPLPEMLPLTSHQTAARWKAGARINGLPVPLGRGSNGIRTLDLQADGPHLLVAGTTGSGKSELLRTLTLALALSYAPDQVNFLFVDFKGGSGLAPLTGLIHCVGLLTDLSGHELERTLTSLRAEIQLREEALALAQVPDLAAYRTAGASQSVPLPHLIIVIDEFRILVDNAPEVLRELLRIAAIGRSLGLHLVMATQRPQGALTADIRANVTTSIALRVQSDTESIDIINSKAAAGISVDAPGRAFLVRGTEPPQEFQAASLVLNHCNSHAAAAVAVGLAVDSLTMSGRVEAEGCLPANQTPAEAVTPLLAMLSELWRELNGPAPRLPVAPLLPSHLPAPPDTTMTSSPSSLGSGRWSVGLGLLDLPEKQKVIPLLWDPLLDSHLAFIGAPSSGATEALELAVMQLLLSPPEAHGYILDAGGTLLALAAHPSIGAHAGLHELRRAVRVLERLKEELARRLAQGNRDGETPLAVVINGWGSWVSAFRAGPLAWAEDLVQDLARDGGRAGIIVMVAGDRELVSSRVLSALPNRFHFPAGSNADSRIAWPRMPAVSEHKGRAVAFGPVAGEVPAVCQLYSVPSRHSRNSGIGACGAQARGSVSSPGWAGMASTRPAKRPFRIDQLPVLVDAAKIRGMTPCPLAQGRAVRGDDISGRGNTTMVDIVIGIGGDDLEPSSCRLPASGVFTVLGRAGAGKSSFLRALPLMNPHGRQWLHPGKDADLSDFWKQALASAAAGETPEGTVALVDDADLLPAETLRDLSDFNALGYRVVLTSTYSPLLLQRVPLVIGSRSAGTGLLLAPRSLSDGDFFGVRYEVEASAPPGRGVLIAQGVAQSIQVGWAGPEP